MRYPTYHSWAYGKIVTSNLHILKDEKSKMIYFKEPSDLFGLKVWCQVNGIKFENPAKAGMEYLKHAA